MDKNVSDKPSLKDASLLAWRVDGRHQRDEVRRTNQIFSQRLRLRDDAPTVN